MAEVKLLIEGYKKFYNEHFINDSALYKELSKGQAPKTLFIACSDSRVDPAIVTQAKPGYLFVIRNVANLVPPFQKDNTTLHGTSAALEFAVRYIGVKHIVVMGHSKCAGVRALVEDDGQPRDDFSFVRPWINIARPARDRVVYQYADHDTDTKAHHCEREVVINSLINLMTFPWVREKVDQKELKLHGWHFSIETGNMQIYNREKNSFEDLEIK